MTTEFKLPELGENIEGGDVVSVLVNEGDSIESGQNILELETDKAVVEVPCPHAGTVTKIHVKQGDRLNVGETVLTLGEGSGSSKQEPASEEKEKEKEKEKKTETSGTAPRAGEAVAAVEERGPDSKQPPAGSPGRGESAAPPSKPSPAAATNGGKERSAPAGPATRRLARQLGVDIFQVSGSGRGGRITAEDVQSYVRSALTSSSGAPRAAAADTAEPPLPDFAQWGEIERQRMGGIRRKTAEAMALANRLIPQVTQFDLADITDLEAARRKFEAGRKDDGGAKVTVTVLAMKATMLALKAMPQFNASLDIAREELILKRYFHIAIAVDTEHGLLVPVVRDVDTKPVTALANELQDLATRARQRKVDLAELQGGCITITNLGGIGGTGFTPIVNYPQVAILGMARARKEQVIGEGGAETRLMLPVCLSYDHRAIDGADGARFLRKIATLLSDPFGLLVEL